MLLMKRRREALSRRAPNKPDAVNPAMALWLRIEYQWRRVTDLERSVSTAVFEQPSEPSEPSEVTPGSGLHTPPTTVGNPSRRTPASFSAGTDNRVEVGHLRELRGLRGVHRTAEVRHVLARLPKAGQPRAESPNQAVDRTMDRSSSSSMTEGASPGAGVRGRSP